MLDLFSGIGGFALAAEWTWGDELDIVGFCEIEKYAQRVLQKNFPGVPIFEDITKLNGKDFKDIDLITGGFPCQDISIAGKGEGITGSRSGLWFEMHRIIREVRPRHALIENVPMLTIRGGTRVIADLAEIGYDAEWQIIGADDVGAWHRRKRIWIVAYLNCDGAERNESKNRTRSRTLEGSKDVSNPDINGDRTQRLENNKKPKKKTQGSQCEIPRSQFKSGRYGEDATDSTSIGSQTKTDKQIVEGEGRGELLSVKPGNSRTMEDVTDTIGKRRCGGNTRRQNAENAGELRRSQKHGYWNAEQPVGRMAHGISDRMDGYWDREPDIPRVATGQANRTHRLKGLGNAVCPQVVYEIMKLIKEAK